MQLFDRLILEFLPAEARHHAHHEHQVAMRQAGFDRRERRRRIERQPGQRPERANLVQNGPRILGRLDVDRERIGPRLAKCFHVVGRVRDHQMHVQRQIGDPPDRLNDRNPDADVGHEMAVHHVQMQARGPGRLDGTHLLLQMRKVARQQRRQYGRTGGAKPGLQFITTKSKCHTGARRRVELSNENERPMPERGKSPLV